MFFKILFFISFISIGSGAPPTHPKKKTNQATYSQSFVRQDVPLSYKYSAVHYYTPKEHIEPKHFNLGKNNNKPEPTVISPKNIQYAPVPQNSNEHSYTTERAHYSSIISTPPTPSRIEYEQYEVPETYDGLIEIKKKLEPKPLPVEAKDIKPSTYKPHLNHHVKTYYNSPKYTLQPHYFPKMKTQFTQSMDEQRHLDMDDDLHHLGGYQQAQLYIKKAKYSATTPSVKYANIITPVISFLPQKNFSPVTTSDEYNKYSVMQPVPRIVYHNNNKVVSLQGAPEKKGRIQMYSRFDNIQLNLNNPKTH